MSDSSPERPVSPEKKRRKTTLEAGESYKKFSSSDILKTIALIKEHPELWNNSDPNYKQLDMKNKLWWQMEKDLDYLKVNRGFNLKKVWTQLHGTYRTEKEKMRQKSGSGSEDYFTEFEFFDDLKFLDSTFARRIPEPSDTSTETCTKRIVQLETPTRDRSRTNTRNTSSRKSESSPDEFQEKHKRLDKFMEVCLSKLDDKKEEKKQEEKKQEHNDLFAMISSTMSILDEEEQFELKLKIGTMCSRLKRAKRDSAAAVFDDIDEY